MFPTDIFRTETQRKILRVLAEKNKQYTMGELAEMSHRSKSSVSRAIKQSGKYPFIKKKRIPGSKEIGVMLDSDSRYTEPIKEFFRQERNQERKNGTVPVDIWNMLEDITDSISQIKSFVELFLFGSYATGEYHAKSDIDLLVLHTPDKEIKERIDKKIDKFGKDIQVLTVEIEKSDLERYSDREILDFVKEKGPVRGIDTVIPLSGKVSP